jgi:hypothetical protein
MKTCTLVFLVLLLTGCATHKGTDGNTYYWIAPIPTTPGYATGRSSQVTTYQGTVNGTGYTITSFK